LENIWYDVLTVFILGVRMTEPVDIQTVMKEERTFLHDISNQLVVAQGMGAFVDGQLAKAGIDDKVQERMKKVLNSVAKMVDMVKERRETLKSRAE
jgi:hypothetical protein